MKIRLGHQDHRDAFRLRSAAGRAARRAEPPGRRNRNSADGCGDSGTALRSADYAD